jgi:biopolymer transport protein TolQ
VTPLLLQIAPHRLDVWTAVTSAGPMGKAVLCVLALFSVVSWAIIAERWRTFRRAEQESDAFLERFHRGGGLSAIKDDVRALDRSPLAQVFFAGFREISLNPPAAGTPTGDDLDALDRLLRKSASVQGSRLERSLGFLATTASVSPFIGLFGTVWGIMNAFLGIGTAGSASLQSYAPGIAEALVATAAGLAAAIPAVIAYNHFANRLRFIDMRIDEFIADFLHRLQGRRS